MKISKMLVVILSLAIVVSGFVIISKNNYQKLISKVDAIENKLPMRPLNFHGQEGYEVISPSGFKDKCLTATKFMFEGKKYVIASFIRGASIYGDGELLCGIWYNGSWNEGNNKQPYRLNTTPVNSANCSSFMINGIPITFVIWSELDPINPSKHRIRIARYTPIIGWGFPMGQDSMTYLPDTGKDNIMPSLWLDQDSNPIVSWVGTENGQNTIYTTFWRNGEWADYNNNTNPAFEGVVIQQPFGGYAKNPKIFLNSTGTPCILFTDKGVTGEDVYLIKRNQTNWVSWSNTVIMPLFQIPGLASSANFNLMSDGNIEIAFIDGLSSLIYIVYWNGIQWVWRSKTNDVITNITAWSSTEINPVVVDVFTDIDNTTAVNYQFYESVKPNICQTQCDVRKCSEISFMKSRSNEYCLQTILETYYFPDCPSYNNVVLEPNDAKIVLSEDQDAKITYELIDGYYRIVYTIKIDPSWFDFATDYSEYLTLVNGNAATFAICFLSVFGHPVVLSPSEIILKKGETKTISVKTGPTDGCWGNGVISRLPEDVLLPRYTVRCEESTGTSYTNRWSAPIGVDITVIPSEIIADRANGVEFTIKITATQQAINFDGFVYIYFWDSNDKLRDFVSFKLEVKNFSVSIDGNQNELTLHLDSSGQLGFNIKYDTSYIPQITPTITSTLPNGLTVAFDPPSLTPPNDKYCIMTVNSNNTILPDRYKVDIKFASADGDYFNITVYVIITVFELSVDQPIKRINKDVNQVSFNIDVIPDVGYTGKVVLSLIGLPDGYTYSFSPSNSIDCTGQTVTILLTINSSNTTNDLLNLKVNGYSNYLWDNKNVDIQIMKGKFWAWSSKLHKGLLPGQKGKWKINLESFSIEDIALSINAEDVPTNWTYCFNDSDILLSNNMLTSISFSIDIPSSEPQGTNNITINISGSGETLSLIIPVDVQGYAIEVAASQNIELNVGETKYINVNVISMNGFDGPVLLLMKINPPVWWLQAEILNNPVYCVPNGQVASIIKLSIDGGAPVNEALPTVSVTFVSEGINTSYEGPCVLSTAKDYKREYSIFSTNKKFETLNEITIKPKAKTINKVSFLTPPQKIIRQIKHNIGEKPIQCFSTTIPYLAINVSDPNKYQVTFKEIQANYPWDVNECSGIDYAYLSFVNKNDAFTWPVDANINSLYNINGYCDKVYENTNCSQLPQDCNKVKPITNIQQAYRAIGRPSISSISPNDFTNVMSKIYSSEDQTNGTTNTNICISDIRIFTNYSKTGSTSSDMLDIELPLRIIVPFVGIFEVKDLITGSIEINKATSSTLIVYEKPLPNHSQGAEQVCGDWYAGDTHVHSACGGTRMGQPSYEGEEVVDNVLVGCKYQCDCSGSIEYPGGPSILQRAEEARELNFDFMYLADHVVGGACSDNANLAWKTAMTVSTSTNDPDNLMVAVTCPEPDPQSDPIETGCGCARVWNYIKAFNRDTMMIGKDPNGYTNSQETAYQFYNCEFTTPPPPAPPPIELPPYGAPLCDYGLLASQVPQTNNPVSSIINNQAVSCNGCQGHLVSNYRGSKIEPFLNNKLLTLRRSNATCEKIIPPCNAFPVPQNKQQTYWKYITSIITHPHETSCGSPRKGQTFIRETDKIYPHQNEEPSDQEFPGIHGFPWQYPENLNTTDPWGNWPTESPWTYPDEGMTHRAHPMTGCTAKNLPYDQRIPNIYGYDGMEVIYEGYNLSYNPILETYDRWRAEVGKELGSVVHDDIHPLDKNIINWVPNEGPPVKFERDIWHPFPVGASNVLRWWMEPWCRYYGKNMTYIHAREFTATPNDTKTTGLRHPLGYYLRVGKTIASGAGSFATMWLGTNAGGLFYPDSNPNNTNCNTDTNTFQPGDIVANGYPIPEYKAIGSPVHFRILMKSAWTGGKPKKVTVYLDRWGSGTQQEPPRVYTKGFKTWDLSDCGTPITDPNDYWYYIDDFYTPGQIGTGPWCLNVTAEFSNPNGPDEVVICAPIYSKR